MPLDPPPGFEEAFAAACPACGVAVGDHRSAEEHQEHLTVWMADPDQTPDEALEFSAGVIASIQRLFHIGLPRWAIEQVIRRHVTQLADVLDRRKAATNG